MAHSPTSKNHPALLVYTSVTIHPLYQVQETFTNYWICDQTTKLTLYDLRLRTIISPPILCHDAHESWNYLHVVLRPINIILEP